MRKLRLSPITLCLIFTVLGCGVIFGGQNKPGPQSIPSYSKINLAGLLGGSDKDKTGEEEGHSHADDDKAEPVTLLIAVIQPTEGYTASGVVFFKKVDDGVEVSGEIEGLKPGKHGFHVHQYGDISADDGTSAGGHFNPTGQPHASRTAEHRHVGDLGNITADENGVATFSFVDSELSMKGTDSIIGRGLIVHRDADDLTSQPTGAAGPRAGMAVIGVADPEQHDM